MANLIETAKEQVAELTQRAYEKAAAQGLRFDDQETSLIVSVLTASMGPSEKKKVETLRLLSKKLAGRR